MLLNKVFRRMRLYAAEKGHHHQISADAMQLKDSVTEGEKDLMFNPNDYKSRYQVCFDVFVYNDNVGIDVCIYSLAWFLKVFSYLYHVAHLSF